jgi:hypothetical protein
MIRFSCSCGKGLQAKVVHAGQRVTCPDCGAKLVVPEPDDFHIQDGPDPGRRPAGEDAFENRRELSASAAYSDRVRKQRPDGEAKSNKTVLIIGGIAAGVSVLAATIVVLFLVLGKGDDAPSSQDSGVIVNIGDEPRVRTMSENNLRQITLALHNYHDIHKRFPPAVVYDRNGKPLYSWRVLILPFIEEEALYRQFHYNEPWDSPHNKALLERMPRTFGHPGSASKTDTHYLVFDSPAFINPRSAFNSKLPAGPVQPAMLQPFPFVPPPGTGQVFEIGVPGTLTQFTDGTSNTIMVIEADEAVPWTKPADLVYEPSKPLPKLGGLYPSGKFVFATADGAVRAVDRMNISDATLRAAITANGGEIMGADWERGP